MNKLDYTSPVALQEGFMVRKSQTNPSRSKSTPRAKPPSAAASSAKRQSATAKEKLDATANEATTASQLHSSHAAEDASIGANPQPLPAQSQALTNGMHDLQQQFAVLKEQFEQVQSNYLSLQHTSSDQTKAIHTLQGQLEQQTLEVAAKQEQYSELQQKTIAQTQIIEQLREQVTALDRQLEQRSSEQKPDADSWQNISDPINAVDLNNVHQQMSALRTEFDQQVLQQMTQQQRYAILQRQCDEQAQVIAELRSLVTQEQHHAAIGEAYLNKWRYRTFSS